MLVLGLKQSGLRAGNKGRSLFELPGNIVSNNFLTMKDMKRMKDKHLL